MTILITGLILFFSVHAIPLFSGAKLSLVSRLGENRFRGLFAFFSLAGFAAIVFGMKGAPFEPVWNTPSWSPTTANLAMPVAFCLLAAAYLPNNFRRVVRNPMLSATLLWSLAHLLSNGGLASMLLFGSFGVFAIADILSVNSRSEVQVADRKPLYYDVLTIAVGLAAFCTVRYFHADLFGVPVAY